MSVRVGTSGGMGAAALTPERGMTNRGSRSAAAARLCRSLDTGQTADSTGGSITIVIAVGIYFDLLFESEKNCLLPEDSALLCVAHLSGCHESRAKSVSAVATRFLSCYYVLVAPALFLIAC